MPHLIGTDEAGYGPNLGPLTITGTLWEVPDLGVDLYSILEGVVTNSPTADTNKLFVADSKRVYGSTRNLSQLETPVLAVLFALFGQIPNDWRELAEMICDVDSTTSMPSQFWLSNRRLALPMAANAELIRQLGDQFLAGCRNRNVRLTKIRCATIFAPEFNQGIETAGNKATLLSSATLESVRKLLQLTNEDVSVGCDKHGGRSKYAGLIQKYVTDEYVFVGRESLEASDYHFEQSSRSVSLRFEAKGESFLPTALSSMVSKYVREVFMELWNDFWQIEVPGIKPTKGYPQDAKRFKQEIHSKQAQLGIEDNDFWRVK